MVGGKVMVSERQGYALNHKYCDLNDKMAVLNHNVAEASLGRVDELIHIGRGMRTIALQSAVGVRILSFAGVLVDAAGYLPPVAGAVTQEIIDVIAVLNALRMVLPSADLEEVR